MAFTYGWRRSELLGLKVRDINLSDGTVRLLKTKNGESREVPLTPGIKQMLRKLVEGQSQDAPLFPARSDFYEWGLICAEAGVPCGENGGYIFHDIRRSSARNKRAAGVDTSLIMAMQGWKTEHMFRRYAIVDTTDLSRALAQEAKFMKEAAC
jgi:integrase